MSLGYAAMLSLCALCAAASDPQRPDPEEVCVVEYFDMLGTFFHSFILLLF